MVLLAGADRAFVLQVEVFDEAVRCAEGYYVRVGVNFSNSSNLMFTPVQLHSLLLLHTQKPEHMLSDVQEGKITLLCLPQPQHQRHFSILINSAPGFLVKHRPYFECFIRRTGSEDAIVDVAQAVYLS